MVLGALVAVLSGGSMASACQDETSTDPANAADAVEAILRESDRMLGQGMVAEAEQRVRDAIRDRVDARLEFRLAEILYARAAAFPADSDLARSLRDGLLHEAIDRNRSAKRSDSFRERATLGIAACLELMDRSGDAAAELQNELGELRREGIPPERRATILRQLIWLRASSGDAEGARTAVEDGLVNGELREGDDALERLRILAAGRDSTGLVEAAVAAVRSGAESFESAYLVWEAGGGSANLELELHVYSRMLELRPEDPELRYYRGAVRFHLGDPEGALHDLSVALAAPATATRARSYQARALLRLGRDGEAFELLARLLDDPDAPLRETLEGLIGVAVARARRREFSEALEAYDLVLQRDESNYWAHLGRPLCLRSLGDLQSAALAYEAGIEHHPDEPQLLNDYALLLQASGDTVRAMEMFERAIAGGSADAGENLGMRAWRRGDVAAANRFFARTLLLDPDRPRIRLYREFACIAALDAEGTTGVDSPSRRD